MGENNLVKVETVTALEAINRTEIDMQIATAKAYPRNIQAAMANIEALATINPTTADECFYTLPRGGSNIEGVSVRFAEIVASCWGNLRVQTRIIGQDAKHIITQGVCHDLESNVAISVEVKRRITDKTGRTYNDDMVTVTSQAASAIAYRNAVLKIVPKAVIAAISEKVKAVALNSIKAEDIPSIAEKMFAYFAGKGVDEKTVLRFLKVGSRKELTAQHIYMLRTVNTAIKEGTATMQEVFFQNLVGDGFAGQVMQESEENLQMVEQAMRGGK